MFCVLFFCFVTEDPRLVGATKEKSGMLAANGVGKHS